MTRVTLVCLDLDSPIGTSRHGANGHILPNLTTVRFTSAPPSIVRCVLEDCLRILSEVCTPSRPLLSTQVIALSGRAAQDSSESGLLCGPVCLQTGPGFCNLILSEGMRFHESYIPLQPRRYLVYGTRDKVRPRGFETASDST